MDKMQEVNVRVAVRVRPLLPKEKLAAESSCLKIIPSSNQLIMGKDRAFTFDHVLSSKTAQTVMYEKCVDSLVKCCFEGYNATIFAYGQTGSGKTFTVGGGNITAQTEDEFGIIPRAIKHMFDIMLAHDTRDYIVKVSYIEIYKEELRDLLDLETSTKDLHIREDDKGNTMIMGISEIECETAEEVMTLLEQGSLVRHTGSTQMNEHSSRSHSVFTIFIEQKWSDGENNTTEKRRDRKQSDESEIVIDDTSEIEHYMCAKFHFVDLAGSERANRTGNVGDRFRESVHINSGLLALGNVISALGDVKKKVSHIPYRDSKITRLLKDSLGGNAQTLMICCISPATSSFDESLNALKYANRARNIKNKPIVNRDPQSIRFEEMQSEIRALREELQRQRTSMVVPMSAHDPPHELQRAMQEACQVKELEDKIVRLQTECAHYRMVAEEAYKQLTEIRDRDILSHSQTGRLRDWMELMEEIKHKVPATLNKDAWENQTISRLEGELKRCKNDLQSDEEIFAEKAREVGSLQDRLTELEESNGEYQHRMEEYQERLKLQADTLVEKQVFIDELQQQLKEAVAEEEEVGVESSMEMTLGASGPPTTSRRAKSVPAQFLGARMSKKEDLPRNIHTSPALFSLERVMQGFRARSQLLISHLEDSDDVLQQGFSDEDKCGEDEEDEDELDGQVGEDGYEQKEVDEVFENEKSAFQREVAQRRTYKVRRPKLQKPGFTQGARADTQTEEAVVRKSQTDDEKIKANGHKFKGSKTFTKAPGALNTKAEVSKMKVTTEIQRKKLKQTELDVRQSTQKMRDLNVNIRMKEQLIKELVKTGRDSQVMNKQYEEKIKALEKEKQGVKQEYGALQKAYQDMEEREAQDKAEKDRLGLEFRKKMELAKMKLHSLQKKQKDTEKMATITGHTDKRIQDLEVAVDKMKQQQDQLQRRLKDEVERKAKLEREMTKEQQRISELEIRNEQQKKVLRVKTDEMTALGRRLRSASTNNPLLSDEQGRLDEQKRWLDTEIEKVLEQRKQVEDLQKELQKRETIVSKKESLLAERSELEIKKLRSSQVLNKDIVLVSSKLDSVEKRLEEKAKEIAMTPREQQNKVKDELQKLHQGRDKLRKQRGVLEEKLQSGALLSPQEERRLIEVDEGVDALDAAIEYKNDTIVSRQQELRKSVMLSQSEDTFVSKLRSLSATETKTLLSKYFEKVVDLRETERRKDLRHREFEMQIEEQEHLIQELESSLQRTGMDQDRKLMQQQQDYERKIQVLVHQVAELSKNCGTESGGGGGGGGGGGEADAKIHQLEKDLYYYKKTSRELKKRLRELMGGSSSSGGGVGGGSGSLVNGPEGDRDNGDLLTPTPREFSGQASGDGARRATGTPRASSNCPLTRSAAESSGSKNGDKVSTTPVRISRRELRRMSEEEVNLRKSGVSLGDVTPRDSLEAGKNL